LATPPIPGGAKSDEGSIAPVHSNSRERRKYGLAMLIYGIFDCAYLSNCVFKSDIYALRLWAKFGRVTFDVEPRVYYRNFGAKRSFNPFPDEG
jgi:hypothetical protein